MEQILFWSCLTTNKLKPLGFLFKALLVDWRGQQQAMAWLTAWHLSAEGLVPSATMPHVSHCLFCSPACGAQLLALILDSAEQHRKATGPWAQKKYEGHQPSRNKPASAISSGLYRETHHYISWTSFFIWELFSLPLHPNANLGSEIPANYQGASKIPSSAAGFWCVHGNVYKHQWSENTHTKKREVCACFSTSFLPYRDSFGNHSLSPQMLAIKIFSRFSCERMPTENIQLCFSSLKSPAWSSGLRIVSERGTEAQRKIRDATLERCKEAGGAETKRDEKE